MNLNGLRPVRRPPQHQLGFEHLWEPASDSFVTELDALGGHFGLIAALFGPRRQLFGRLWSVLLRCLGGWATSWAHLGSQVPMTPKSVRRIHYIFFITSDILYSFNEYDIFLTYSIFSVYGI